MRGSISSAERIARLKAEREPLYAQAPIHVRSEAGPHNQAVHRILKGIAQWL